MFAVYEGGAPANNSRWKNRDSHSPAWANSRFDTFAEAVAYARKWLGEYDCLPLDWDGKPFDYSGYGDLIEIRDSGN